MVDKFGIRFDIILEMKEVDDMGSGKRYWEGELELWSMIRTPDEGRTSWTHLG